MKKEILGLILCYVLFALVVHLLWIHMCANHILGTCELGGVIMNVNPN